MDMKRQYEPEPEPERQTESYAQRESEPSPDPDMDLALDLCMQQQPCAPSEELVDAGKQEVRYCVQEKLRQAGYLPPPPPPLAAARSLHAFAEEACERVEHLPADDPATAAFREALRLVDVEVQAESEAALQFFEKLSAKLRPALAPFFPRRRHRQAAGYHHRPRQNLPGAAAHVKRDRGENARRGALSRAGMDRGRGTWSSGDLRR